LKRALDKRAFFKKSAQKSVPTETLQEGSFPKEFLKRGLNNSQIESSFGIEPFYVRT